MRPDTYRKRVLKIPKPVYIFKTVVMIGLSDLTKNRIFIELQKMLKPKSLISMGVISIDASCNNPYREIYIFAKVEIKALSEDRADMELQKIIGFKKRIEPFLRQGPKKRIVR